MLVGAAKNPNLSQANINRILLALKQLTKDSIESKYSRSQEGEEIKIEALLSGQGFKVFSGFEDEWEIFQDVIDAYENLILNPAALSSKAEYIKLLLHFYETFTQQKKNQGVEIIVKALQSLADQRALFDTGHGRRIMQILALK
jgi:hypothetical protein